MKIEIFNIGLTVLRLHVGDIFSVLNSDVILPFLNRNCKNVNLYMPLADIIYHSFIYLCVNELFLFSYWLASPIDTPRPFGL